MEGKCQECEEHTELSEADYNILNRKICWYCLGSDRK